MSIQTAAGAKVFIGPANETADDEAAFSALTYSEIGEVEEIGEFGDQANEIKFAALGNRRVRKLKGSFDAGTLELTVGRDPQDEGQAAIAAALASNSDYAIKIELGDGDDGTGGEPTTFYFRAKVMSYTSNLGDVENVVRSKISLGINSDIVEIPAS